MRLRNLNSTSLKNRLACFPNQISKSLQKQQAQIIQLKYLIFSEFYAICLHFLMNLARILNLHKVVALMAYEICLQSQLPVFIQKPLITNFYAIISNVVIKKYYAKLLKNKKLFKQLQIACIQLLLQFLYLLYLKVKTFIFFLNSDGVKLLEYIQLIQLISVRFTYAVGTLQSKEIVFLFSQVMNQIVFYEQCYNHQSKRRIDMQKIYKMLGQGLKAFDFFPNKQFIRYEHENEYKTATGGTLSLAIIIIFAILFLNNGLKTLRKELITSSFYSMFNETPSPIDIKLNDKTFMFAIFMYGFNLTDPNIRWFDISVTQFTKVNAFTVQNATSIPLIPCTQQHFSITQSIKQNYKKYSQGSWLCPPLNSTLHLQGKTSSATYSFIDIQVAKCNSSVHNNCASDAMIQQVQTAMKQLVFAIPLVTTVINPSNSQYKSYKFQDRNYFYFSTSQFGVTGEGYFQDYAVDTDQSIFPLEQHEIEYGATINNLFTQREFNIANFSTYYADFTISKSPQGYYYNRSFQKIDQYLSYVGGLIGIVLILFFIFNFYTQTAYSISLASKLFTYNDKDVQFSRFNFLYFVVIKVINIFKYFKCCIPCDITQQFIKCKDQIEKQVDITYILRRINNLETAAQIMFEKNQYESLCLRKKQEINEIAEKRRLYQITLEGIASNNQDSNKVAHFNEYQQSENQNSNKDKQMSCSSEVTPKMMKTVKLQLPAQSNVRQQELNNESSLGLNDITKEKATSIISQLRKQAKSGNLISCKIAKKLGLNLSNDTKKFKETIKIQQFPLDFEDISSK